MARFGIPLWVVAIGLTGCNTLGLPNPFGGSAVSMENQYVSRSLRHRDLVSKMLPVQLRLRDGWQPAPTGSLHRQADLEAYHPDQGMYLIVLGESREALDNAAADLEEQATLYLQLLKGEFDNTLSGETQTNVNQVNSLPAVQYELRGEVLGQAVAYLHTTLELDDHYYQVVVWTADNRWETNESAMGDIVQGFRVDQN
ncbi:hypothetical protein [Nodosilinea sp. P-1105]|uniref:hypothetical protein n=1 Tax=Nodosilinea sp. P-1105 TaxID=2546229 RepID=UPI00146F3682|nr:hypothetical protein [Nodosilinea sp. P-1105]NMF84134.1 hypothetical protein [Nodosilinea sp. P-1105]